LVLDTNIAIAGLLWSGPPHRLFNLAVDKRITLISSDTLSGELRKVLARRHLAKPLARRYSSLEEAIADYRELTRVINPTSVPRVVPDDPDDDHVIACAVAAQADAIVSGDRHILVLQPSYQGIDILTPKQAVDRIE
jgi:putative PIN family toxin of toxin-antitoxin system